MFLRKKGLSILLAIGVIASLLSGCAQSDDKTVMSIDGNTMSYGEANFYARYFQQQYEIYYSYFGQSSDNMWSQPSSTDSSKTMEEVTKDNILETLKSLLILDNHKDEYDVNLSEDDMAKIMDQVDKLVEANNNEDAAKKLSITETNAKRILSLLAIQSKMSEKMTQDVDTDVSDEDAAQKKMHYIAIDFESNFSSVSTIDDAVSAINDAQSSDDDSQLPTEEEAEDMANALMKKLKEEGADSDTIVDLASEEGYTATELTFDSTTTSLSADVIKAADLLKKGEMCVASGESAAYVIYLDSEFDDEATQAKKNEIVYNRKQDAYDKLYESWLDEADFKLHKSVWNSIDFDKLGSVPAQVEGK